MLIRQTLLYLPAQLLAPLVQFIAAIVWTHFLSARDYGDLMILLAMQDLVFLLGLSWWTQYSMRYLADISGNPNIQHLQSAENSILLMSGLAQAAMTIIAVMLFLSSPSPTLLFLTVIFVVTRGLLTHLAERTRLQARIFDYTLTQMIGPILGTFVGFLLIVNYGGGVQSAIAGFVLAQLVSLIIIWMRLRFGTGVSWPPLAILKAAFSFGFPLLVAGGLAWFSVNGIRLIVEHMRGSADVGLLSVGWGLGQRAISVIAMLVTAASYPLALKHMNMGKKDKAFAQVSLNGALLIGLILPTIIGVLYIAPSLIKLMVGAEFQNVTYVILPIAIVAAGLRNMRVHFLDQIFVLVEKPVTLLWVSVVEVVATLLLCWVGLIFYGLAGAALGCLLGTSAGALTCWWLAQSLGLKMPWVHLFKVCLASLIMAIVLHFAGFGDGYEALIFKVLLGVSTYCIAHTMLYMLRPLSRP